MLLHMPQMLCMVGCAAWACLCIRRLHFVIACEHAFSVPLSSIYFSRPICFPVHFHILCFCWCPILRTITTACHHQTGFEEHTLNISTAIMKDDEGKHFTDLVGGSVSTMQGIGPKATEVASALNLDTVEDLANYKYFKW